jgi:hypothetical protein
MERTKKSKTKIFDPCFLDMQDNWIKRERERESFIYNINMILKRDGMGRGDIGV